MITSEVLARIILRVAKQLVSLLEEALGEKAKKKQ